MRRNENDDGFKIYKWKVTDWNKLVSEQAKYHYQKN